MSGSATNNNKPPFSGTVGTAAGAASTVTVQVFAGSRTDTVVQTLATPVSGRSWSVAPGHPLANGTYTALARQAMTGGITRVSEPSTFTVNAVTSRGTDVLTPGASGVSSPDAAPVTTTSTYSVGGTVAGLSGTVVLQDNGGDDLSLSSDGPFSFATPLADGAAYNVTVKSNPSGQICAVSGGAGTVAAANVTSVAITCANRASDDFDRADGGLGAAWAAMSDGGLSIVSQQVVGPAARSRAIFGSGRATAAISIRRVEVTSTQLSGGEWIGPTVRSQNGGQDTHTWGSTSGITATRSCGSMSAAAGAGSSSAASYDSGPLPAGTQLTLSAVGSEISFQQNGVERIAATDSTLTGGAPGIMTYGAATADNWAGGTGSPPPPLSTYSIGGTVSGLSGTVVLQDNGGDDLSVSSNGAFTFATPVADGVAYNVTVKSNPSGETCTISSGSGTVAAANVTSVAVTCAARSVTPPADDFDRADGGLGAAGRR